MDENAENEWAGILAAGAPPLSDRQITRLRRLFDVRRSGVRGHALPVGESVPACGTDDVSRVETDAG